MSAYGIAGLVDGFFKGRELRHGWDDRKDAKKRQEKMDGYYEAEQGRVAERHGWARDNYGRLVSDYDRNRADDDERRRIYADADEATRAALGAPPPEDQTTTGTSKMDGPPPGPASEIAGNLAAEIDATTRKSASAGRFERGISPSKALGAPQGAPAGPRRADAPEEASVTRQGQRPDVNWMATGNERPVPTDQEISFEAQQEIDRRKAGAMGAPQRLQQPSQDYPPMYQDAPQAGQSSEMVGDPWAALRGTPEPDPRAAFNPDRMLAPDDAARVAEGKARAAKEAERAAWMADQNEKMRQQTAETLGAREPNYKHEWGSSLPKDVRETRNRAQGVLGAVPGGILDAAGQIGNAARDGLRGPVEYATGGGFTLPKYENEAANKTRAATPLPDIAPAAASQPASATGPGPRVSNVPASATPQERQLADVATDAMTKASTPALEAAAAAVAKDSPSLGAPGKKPMTEGQRTRAADAYIDQYRKVGAPMVIEGLLKQGKLDDAIKFQEFIDTGEVKQGMKHLARATFAAAVGDFDTFADEIFAGQNVAGYFGDSVTIDKTKSGFTRDADGNINGAKVWMVDSKTGNSFEQVFESPEDLIQAGIAFLDPMVQFTMNQQKVEAAKAAALGAVKTRKDEKDALDKRVDGQVKIILEASKDALGNPTITYEEARAKAEAVLSGQSVQGEAMGAPGGDGPAMPPVLRRP